MGSPIVVTYATITGGAAEIRAISSNIKGRLDDLRSRVNAVASSWEGDAQTQYAAKQAEWDRAQSELCTLLDQIAKALEGSAQVYQDTEKANTQMWS